MLNKKNVGIIVLIGGLLCFMILSMRNFEVFAIGLFWDLKGFIMVTIISFLIILSTYSLSEISDYLSCLLKNKFENKIMKLEILEFLKHSKNTFLYTGIFTFFFSIMMMLSDISSSEVIGKNLGTAICCILYSSIMILIFINPAENRIKQSLIGDI